MSHRPTVFHLLPAALLAVFLSATYHSLLFTLTYKAVADGDIPTGLRWIPAHPGLLVKRGSPADLNRAAELAPTVSEPRILLGLHQESLGNIAAAERLLLDAAKIDATYQPRWTLANFYLRHNRVDLFWVWTHQAAAIRRDDLTPLLQTALRLEPNPARWPTGFLPERLPARLQLIHLLIANNLLTDAFPYILELPSSQHRELFLAYCDRLLAAKLSAPAIRVWNLLGAGMLDPVQGRSLTNPSFQASCGACFDWRLPPVERVSLQPSPTRQLLAIELSTPPLPATLARQWIPVIPQSRYKLSIDYTWTGPPTPAARWIAAGQSSKPLEKEKAKIEFLFDSRSFDLIELELRAEHAPGYSSPRGRLEISHLNLELLSWRGLEPP